MASRNDLCPCGSGKKYKKCCLGAPDPKSVLKTKVLLYGSFALIVVTVAVFFLAGQGVGAAVGLASFGLIIGYALAGGSPSSGSSTPASPGARKPGGKAASGGARKKAR